MKKKMRTILCTIFIISSCLFSIPQNETTNRIKYKDVEKTVKKLNSILKEKPKKDLTKLENFINDKFKEKKSLTKAELKVLNRYLKRIAIIKVDYVLTYNELFRKLKIKIKNLKKKDIEKWESNNLLNYYIINGEKRYFFASVSNLFLLNKKAAKRAKFKKKKRGDDSKYPIETIENIKKNNSFSKTINVSFAYFEETAKLAKNTLIKGWIPYPRENQFQSNIKIVKSSEKKIMLPSKELMSSMIFFTKYVDVEKKINWKEYFNSPTPTWISKIRNNRLLNGSNSIFHFIFKYNSLGHFKKIYKEEVKDISKDNPIYKKYCKEDFNYLFTPYLKKVSKEILLDEKNPFIKARKIYEWICKNITWVVQTPILGNINEFSAKYRRGDCGRKAELFITLCKLNDIPARIQGGWRIEPDSAHSNHSWAQIYFKKTGWIPVDPDAGSHLISNKDPEIKYFYFGNRTPYRLIIYDDSNDIFPHKKYPCLYGGGMQLGAFEWDKGDIEPNIAISTYIE